MNNLIMRSFGHFLCQGRRFKGGSMLFSPLISAGIVSLTSLLACMGTSVLAADQKFVNIYSYRQEVLIAPLLDRFTEVSGIQARLVSGKADVLLERLKSEGRNSPADVLLTADAGRLFRALEIGVLQPVHSKILDTLIPPQYREPNGYWYGLSLRARPIMYAVDRVAPQEL